MRLPPVAACSLGALLALAALTFPAAAQQQPAATALVIGRVTDAVSGRPLADVVVEVEGMGLRALTDSAGVYRILRVPAGPQVLRAELFGYAPARMQVTVPAGGSLASDLTLAFSALQIEGIVVTADPAGRAEGELGTASVIGREAVAHQPTTSLANVLSLIPGVSVTPPGLESGQRVALRSAVTTSLESRELAAFGTAVILDGVPLSNNANLQSAPSGVAGLLGASAGGIDLSRLPSSTIERVEVIRGVPSARYGDLTQGAVVVETRAGVVDPDVGVQFDSRTLNTSLVGGRRFFEGHTGTAALDVTRYLVSPGITEDVASRFNLQLAHRAEVQALDGTEEPRLGLDTRLDVYQVRADRALREEETSRYTSWNRDRGVRLSNRTRVRLPGSVRLNFTLSAQHEQQRSYFQELKSSGAMPFTDRLTEGRSQGRFIAGSYLGQLQLEGDPWLVYGRMEGEATSSRLGFDHQLRAGTELRREWNAGPGYRFEMDRPPQVSFTGVDGFDRPRPFDEIPALATTALYLDDRLTRTLLGDRLLRVQAGARLDILHAGTTWASGVRDAVLQPRINAELLMAPWLRLRAGWGRVAKTPPLSQLYPAPDFYDLVNVNSYANNPAERLAVLTTFIEDPTNPDLGFSVSGKLEAGAELALGGAAVTLVAYREKIRGGVGLRPEPSFLLRDRYALEPTAPGQPPRLLEPPIRADTIPILVERPANNTDLTTRGVEVTALFPEIRPLRTRVQIQAAWTESQQVKSDLEFGGATRYQGFQLTPAQKRIPYWDARIRNGRSALATYRLIHQQPELGLVVTGWVQHNLSDRVWDEGGTDTLSFGGYLMRDARLVPVPPERRGDSEYSDLRRTRSGLVVELRSTPADWMMGIQVSKTLPLNGRLSFWAFNSLDRRGYQIEADVYPRTYPSRRFGLELTLPARALFGRA
ncbi:MAG: TonB-dependent receptor [Longimicrobiales bacterium]|nr:TonB-dependent receptor [Longimicrobiales bacterium]